MELEGGMPRGLKLVHKTEEGKSMMVSPARGRVEAVAKLARLLYISSMMVCAFGLYYIASENP